MKMELFFIHTIKERNMQEIKAYFRPEIYIEYCKACKYYDKIWTCPSYDFDIANLLEGYQYVYIIGSKLNLDALRGELKSLDEDKDADYLFNEIYHDARKALDEELISMEDKEKQLRILLAGRCLQCSHCTRERQLPCTYPEKAHYSLEALGFDVASLCEEILGEKLQWAKDRLPEYMTLVSAILSKEKLNIQDIHSFMRDL